MENNKENLLKYLKNQNDNDQNSLELAINLVRQLKLQNHESMQMMVEHSNVIFNHVRTLKGISVDSSKINEKTAAMMEEQANIIIKHVVALKAVNEGMDNFVESFEKIVAKSQKDYTQMISEHFTEE